MNTTGSLRFVMSGAMAVVVAACIFSSVSVTRVQAHADAKKEGAALFASSGCGHCHGDMGEGTAKGPSLKNLRKQMNADAVAKQIKDGGKTMPAFGDSLNDEQIEDLVKFLRARHPKFEKPAPEKP